MQSCNDLFRMLILPCFLLGVLLPGNTPQAADEFPDEGTIVPASPMAFEPVHLVLPTMAVDGYCHAVRFSSEFNEVERTDDGLLVRARNDWMTAPHPLPGPCVRQWVRLGQLPAGEYRVDLVIEGAQTGQAEYHFTVSAPAAGLLTTPAFDYGGFYWDPLESGSALQVIQTGRRNLGVVLLTYDDDGAPIWILITLGSWQSPGWYVGQAFRTRNGHPISAAAPVERVQAETELIGSASLRFGGGLGIDPLSASVQITRADGLIIERYYRRFDF